MKKGKRYKRSFSNIITIAPGVTEKATFVLWSVKIVAILHSVLKYKLHMREEAAVDFNEVNPTAREDLSDQATN